MFFLMMLFMILLLSVLLNMPPMAMNWRPASRLFNVFRIPVSAMVEVDVHACPLSHVNTPPVLAPILPMSAAYVMLPIPFRDAGMFWAFLKVFSLLSTTSKSCHKLKKVPGLLEILALPVPVRPPLDERVRAWTLPRPPPALPSTLPNRCRMLLKMQ
jgi:hypothetical protein